MVYSAYLVNISHVIRLFSFSWSLVNYTLELAYNIPVIFIFNLITTSKDKCSNPQDVDSFTQVFAYSNVKKLIAEDLKKK